jgi:threonine synthase
VTASRLAVAGRRGIIRRYFEHLPVSDATPIVTLDEGDTPLIFSERISAEVSAEVWLKHEGLNPTGSFKDRGMTLAISKALESGARAVVCASTGNTSASAAAYAGRAGLTCVVLIPNVNVALGKLAQALVHGARVFQIDGNFDRALDVVRELASERPMTMVNSLNPYRIQGQQTAALEIVEALGRAPDVHVMPVGNAGNITAYYRGYSYAASIGWSSSAPALFGVQARGADPIVRGEPMADPRTAATAIRIGNPASWEPAVAATHDTGGAMLSVSDDDITAAYRSLAAEGIFVELASAASVAGLRRLARDGVVAEGASVVCVLTGHGLKDPDWAIATGPKPERVSGEIGPILGALDLEWDDRPPS